MVGDAKKGKHLILERNLEIIVEITIAYEVEITNWKYNNSIVSKSFLIQLRLNRRENICNVSEHTVINTDDMEIISINNNH